MAVHFPYFEAKGRKFFREGLESRDLPGGSETLKAVMVHHQGQGGKFLMGGEEEGFPIGAFFPFPVGHQAENLSSFMAELFSEGQAGREGKSMPQASRGEKDFFAVGGWMPAEGGVILVEKL